MLLLNVSREALKKLEYRKQLEERLQVAGFKLIKKTRQGRKNIYILEDSGITTQNLTIKNVIRTRKVKEFKKYFRLRVSERPYTTEELAEAIKVNKNTITRWDKLLVAHKVLIKDGFYYYKLNKETKTSNLCGEYEHKAYWINGIKLQSINKVKKELGKLSPGSIDNEAEELKEIILSNYYYRVKKYKVNKDNRLYWDLLDQ